MREVAVIGAGSTKFGELWGQSFRALGLEAGMKAMASAGLAGDEIDAVYIGNMSSRFIKQQHIDALVADYTGMAGRHIASTSIEAGGASGGVAFRQGVMAVASGMHDVVHSFRRTGGYDRGRSGHMQERNKRDVRERQRRGKRAVRDVQAVGGDES